MRRDALIILILFLTFILLATQSMQRKSPTFDEPTWVKVAWYLTHAWTWQEAHQVLFHPPLSFYLHGLPLRLLELTTEAPESPPEGELAAQYPYPYFERFRYETVFRIAKFAMLPLALLLGWYVYLWASRLYGTQAGLLALGLYVLNPWLIAYSTIITSDMAVACFSCVAMYHFWRFCEEPTVKQSIFSGLTLGLALLSKILALILLPIFAMLMGIVLYVRRHNQTADSSTSKATKALLWGTAIILGMAFLCVEAGYLFTMQPIQAFHDSQSADLLSRLFGQMPIPLGAYINGVRLHQALTLSLDRTFFLAGEFAKEPWWYYHLAAFVLKNPITLLVLLGVSLGISGHSRWRIRLPELFVLLPIVVFSVYFCLFFPLNNGSRYTLLLYPFVFVWVSRITTWRMLQKSSVRLVLYVLLGWYALSTLVAFPHYLAYCNELIGGSQHGSEWFLDSNVDWGQDLKGLSEYMRAHDIPVVKLAYFGKAAPEYYGIQYIPLNEPEGCRPTPGFIAISVTKLHGLYEQNRNCYQWLERYESIDAIGHSLRLYYLK